MLRSELVPLVTAEDAAVSHALTSSQMDKRREDLRTRLERVWKRRGPLPKPGHERTAEGKETRTPTAGEFYGNLEKVSKSEKD